MHLIGISGFKRSGKNTVGGLLAEYYDGTVKLVGFADKLKIAAARALGFVNESETECVALMDEFKESGRIKASYGPLEYQQTLSGRQYLQWFGTEAGRETFWDSFWIDLMLPNPTRARSRALGTDVPEQDILDAELARRYPGVDLLAVTDVRFPNEAERVRALGGVVWEVLRPGVDGGGHASEQPLPRELVDWQITNDGSIDKLRGEVHMAMYETLR